jgi:hypothetical protein
VEFKQNKRGRKCWAVIKRKTKKTGGGEGQTGNEAEMAALVANQGASDDHSVVFIPYDVSVLRTIYVVLERSDTRKYRYGALRTG